MANSTRVYVDLQNADRHGRLRLNCAGTIDDLQREAIILREGLVLALYSDDGDANGNVDNLVVDGIVSFSGDESCWVAAIDWNAVQHESKLQSTTPPLPGNEAITCFQSHTLPFDRH